PRRSREILRAGLVYLRCSAIPCDALRCPACPCDALRALPVFLSRRATGMQ
ncbi:uncharacterized protein L969DRAFT_90222, partial [Mixia osmundae IAM 14324]|uniref:uncharacterized protein n=1 Tax=Mixia osmundae (strain CBS 9802 / IAM 14324 / JCM 22182 / KY 12970) TaxID=764103 RepID=UPI0004A559EF